MASLEELRNERLKKLEILKNAGINPYPVSVTRDVTLAEAAAQYVKLSKRKKALHLAGRVRAMRGQGALIFIDIDDGTGALQGLIKKNEMREDAFSLFADAVDVGDIVEVAGSLFTTKRKEKTILIKEWKMLAKSLLPMPDKWHGLQDVEERFRKRYLDTLMSSDVKERFLARARIISALRTILGKYEYIEMETPILQPLAGGAIAEPFVTHHNTLDMDMYLRVAPELYLKKLLVGGFPKVYEIGKNFRNEGIDVTHNPEFTMLEFYESFSDARKQMVFVEMMFKTLAKDILEKTSFVYGGNTISFAKKFAVVSLFDLLKRHALIADPSVLTRDDLRIKAEQLGVRVPDTDGTEKIIDNIYKKVCRPKLIQPTFIVDYPIASSPFAKKKEDNPAMVDRFQLVVGGLEVVNAFSELNDPLEQRERYIEQDRKRRCGDAEVSPSDEGYMEAMEHGLPPAGGVGVGVDRLVMLFTDSHNIREAILFPTLKPRE